MSTTTSAARCSGGRIRSAESTPSPVSTAQGRVLRYQGLEGLLIAGRDNRADDRPRRRVALRSQFARAGMPVGYSAPSLMVLMRGVASRRRNSARRR
jgi:hypothetical protein